MFLKLICIKYVPIIFFGHHFPELENLLLRYSLNIYYKATNVNNIGHFIYVAVFVVTIH